MLHQTTLLLLAISPFTVGGDQPKKEPAGPSRLRVEVVDVFDGGKLLLSVGKEDGVRAGLLGTLNRSDDSDMLRSIVGPKFRFVEVGANHSVVQITWVHSYFMAKPDIATFETQFKTGDKLRWQAWPFILQPLPEYRPSRFPGGALIDGTNPKLLPREK